MTIDFAKGNGLVPVIIQHFATQRVLMLGYMNAEAYSATKESGKVTFYSRSKQRLWTKGETSGNFLLVKSMLIDCDSDTLLIKADPQGPVCHTGRDTCFAETDATGFLQSLEQVIQERKDNPVEGSYTNHLLEKGLSKMAQKVGEEGTEVVVAALAETNERLLNESADLLYHLLVLLQAKELSLEQVEAVLKKRHG